VFYFRSVVHKLYHSAKNFPEERALPLSSKIIPSSPPPPENRAFYYTSGSFSQRWIFVWCFTKYFILISMVCVSSTIPKEASKLCFWNKEMRLKPYISSLFFIFSLNYIGTRKFPRYDYKFFPAILPKRSVYVCLHFANHLYRPASSKTNSFIPPTQLLCVEVWRTPWRRVGERMCSSTHPYKSALVGSEWSASRPGRFTPRGKSLRYPLDRWLVLDA
jgi:hypothetical protein